MRCADSEWEMGDLTPDFDPGLQKAFRMPGLLNPKLEKLP